MWSESQSQFIEKRKLEALEEGWFPYIITKSDEQALLEGCWFSHKAADHICNFAEKFCVLPKSTTGVVPFILQQWQRDLLRRLFGWMRPESNLRRFTRAYIEIPKKNGKTALASMIGLYMLIADGESSPEVYCCANDQEQANLVWNNAAEMTEKSAFLSKKITVVRSRYKLVKNAQSWFASWSAEGSSKDGPNIHCAILDELHEWKGMGRDFWRKIRYGGVARSQPLCPLVITTAGADKFSLCFEQHSYASEIIAGTKIDTSFFALIFSANKEKIKNDPGYWKTEEAWREANPSYGVILKKETFESDVIECENNPAEYSSFLRYRLGIWVQADNPWLGAGVWDSNKVSFEEADCQDLACYVGVDLSSVEDTTSVVYVFPYPTGEIEVDIATAPDAKAITRSSREIIKYKVIERVFCPEERILERAQKLNVRYDLWALQGALIPTPGNVIDHEYVLEQIKQDSKIFKNIKVIAYDRYGSDWLVNKLQDFFGEKVVLEPFGQGFASMSDPTKSLFAALKKGRIEHRGNAVFNWQIGNAIAVTDAAGNIKLAKDKSKDKIDLAIALVMGYSQAFLYGPKKLRQSSYSTENYGAIVEKVKNYSEKRALDGAAKEK